MPLHLRAPLLPLARHGTFPLGSAPGTAWAAAEADGEFGPGAPGAGLGQAGQGERAGVSSCLPMAIHTATFPDNLLDTAMNKDKTNKEVPPEGEKVILISEV